MTTAAAIIRLSDWCPHCHHQRVIGDDTAEPHTEKLARLLDLAASVRAMSWNAMPEPSSAAAHELADVFAQLGTDRPIRRVAALVDLWTLIGSDQMASAATVLRSGTGQLGVFPIARSIIEHAGATLWVLAPQLSTRSRGARAALAARKSAEETCRAMAHLHDKGSEQHLHAHRALKELREALCEDFGVATGDEAAIFEEKLASPTEMVSEVGAPTNETRRWQGVYDYLCAVANHPTLRVFDFIDTDAQPPTMELPAAFVETLTRACLSAHLTALDATLHYFGWDKTQLLSAYSRVSQALDGAPTSPGG
jgi:hypothetical protein